MVTTTTAIERGTKIGRFVIVTELGRGGMGAVYAAHDPQLDRQVALKILRDASGDEEDRVRMLREGQAMARVTHANVITVYEVGTENGIVFLAQELLDGGTLGSWLERSQTQDHIVEKFIAAGRGLAAAHAVGLVHRDFKPDNVLLGKDGRVRVADFGLARAESLLADALAITTKGGGPPVATDVDVTGSPMSPLTRTGAVMGTPMYMAPEQHKGERADARSDQFAFCVSLYQALYQAWPYDGKTAPALADAVIAGRLAPPPKATAAAVPASLRKLLLRGLATEPAERYPSMEALLADLEREVRPARSRRTPWLVAGAIVLVAGGVAGAIAVIKARDNAPPAVTTATPTPTSTPTNVDPDLLTSEKGIAWLTTAIDRGQFSDAIEKYNMRATLPNRTPAEAAVDEAAVAYLHVLDGNLKDADKAVASAMAKAGGDATARAYIDLAESALALARAQLPAARDRSQTCAGQLATAAPVLAAICHQLHGEAQATLGDNVAARRAFEAGLALAKQTASAERTSTLQLALAQLDLDERNTDNALRLATQVQTDCDGRNAIGCDVQARIVLARIRRVEGADADALELLKAIKSSAIEAFPVRTAHDIALGEILGYRGETLDDGKLGLDRIEAARAQAEVRGFVLLVLEAKLARLRVILTTGQPDDVDPAVERAALVEQARAASVKRIAALAESAFAELASPDRDKLPADGGVPAVRSGPPGEP